MTIDLTTVWAIIIAFAVFVYVVMDGYGIFLPARVRARDRYCAQGACRTPDEGRKDWTLMAKLPVRSRAPNLKYSRREW